MSSHTSSTRKRSNPTSTATATTITTAKTTTATTATTNNTTKRKYRINSSSMVAGPSVTAETTIATKGAPTGTPRTRRQRIMRAEDPNHHHHHHQYRDTHTNSVVVVNGRMGGRSNTLGHGTTTTNTTTTGTSSRYQRKRKPLLPNPEDGTTVLDNERDEEEECGTFQRKKNSLPDNGNEDNEPFVSSREEVIRTYLDLFPIDSITDTANVREPPSPLTLAERKELETILDFELDGDEWRSDWSGNLAFFDKEVSHPKATTKKSFKQSLLQWIPHFPPLNKVLYNLLRQVYHTDGIPPSAQAILAMADPASTNSIREAMRRVSFDPLVLQQDGWTTTRSAEREGATGGPYWIGAKIRWQDSDAVIIAYVHDPDIGDLWKAYWIEEGISFDLEAEEVLIAKKRWDRRHHHLPDHNSTDALGRKSTRFQVSADYTVPGIQYGIVMASSFSKGARPGVFWPARVMHASESHTASTTGKRSISKLKLDVVFLAPYWNADHTNQLPGRVKNVTSLSEADGSAFTTGPLFQVETIEATEDMIQAYLFNDDRYHLDLDQLYLSFKFTGLPKLAYPRFLDAHRLAMGFRSYAMDHLDSQIRPENTATAALFETHLMSVQAPLFPPVTLQLPFEHILDRVGASRELFPTTKLVSGKEPVLNLHAIMEAFEVPCCWGMGAASSQYDERNQSPGRSVLGPGQCVQEENDRQIVLSNGFDHDHDVEHIFLSMSCDLPLLNKTLSSSSLPSLDTLKGNLFKLLAAAAQENGDTNVDSSDLSKKDETKRCSLIRSWCVLKQIGMDVLSAYGEKRKSVLSEWSVVTERIYRYIVRSFTTKSQGNGVTIVMTDYRCNGHRTTEGCFERAVRIPAALKGAKRAGAGQVDKVRLYTHTEMDMQRVEQEILPMAHCRGYLHRIKKRCDAAKLTNESVVLTDDSQGNGGQDTRGSKGTWEAAVAAVATAITATEKIVNGNCVNAFCATRPPGHHAGRTLHCMKAVSNGFCILNPVACAALYAATPLSEKGLGLRRVCVIDFDVHHGNGTQDILCSTYDPRFLYISLHAGGPRVNGMPVEDDLKNELNHNGKPQSGIYPGKCGDSSPHEGVLNIPLGDRVTSQEVGLALVSKVTPRVNAFLPDLIILSAGFDAHKNDPMKLGTLCSRDYGHITEVACRLASKCCSGRILSILEGGYGVPCCRPQETTMLPSTISTCVDITPTGQVPDKVEDTELKSNPTPQGTGSEFTSSSVILPSESRPPPMKLLDLEEELPSDMDDKVTYSLQKLVDKCHEDGFVECVYEHVRSLSHCSMLE